MARAPRINGGEYTLLIGPEGAELKLFAYPTLQKARANARVALDGGGLAPLRSDGCARLP